MLGDHPCFSANTGARERLYLLGEIGPWATALSTYAYDPVEDCWTNGIRRLKVRTEAAASIQTIARRHDLTERQALQFVGGING